MSSEADAIARANGPNVGLGASVWTSDPAGRGAAVARGLEAGTVWINSHMHVEPDVPFGGMKHSGVGAMFGTAGIAANTQARILRIPKGKMAT